MVEAMQNVFRVMVEHDDGPNDQVVGEILKKKLAKVQVVVLRLNNLKQYISPLYLVICHLVP